MLWPTAQAKVYNAAFVTGVFQFSGSRSEKAGHPFFSKYIILYIT